MQEITFYKQKGVGDKPRLPIDQISRAKEIIATLAFIVFLFWVFMTSSLAGKNMVDIQRLSQGSLFIQDELVVHAYPIISVLLYSNIPSEVFILLSPFATVLIYLLLYFLVSKKIIYLFPVTLLIPLYTYTLLPGMIDWILLPIVYNRIIKGHDFQAISLGIIGVYIHGFAMLFYLTGVLIFIKRFDVLKKIVFFSLPQLGTLLYFSRGYYSAWSNDLWIFRINAFDFITTINFSMSLFWFRILIILSYMAIFLLLITPEKD